jgi:zinc transport system permease protein
MLDDFFIRALIAGIGVAAICGPLGCFMVWRRLSYFGDTLSHSALLGVALALLLNINIMLAVFCFVIVLAIVLLLLQRQESLPSDAILGILAHSSLAMSLVVLGLITWAQVDLVSYLFGDILSVYKSEIAVIYIAGAIILGILFYIWRPLFAVTLNRELAEVEGIKATVVNAIYILMLASVIAVAMKIVGALLITALLIIPASCARGLAKSPESMAIYAAIIGVISVVLGLYGSLYLDTLSGPSIVVAAMFLFLLTLTPLTKIFK